MKEEVEGGVIEDGAVGMVTREGYFLTIAVYLDSVMVKDLMC
jgi:C4-dicarboxylate-specific signal transduction histidine kinase